MSEPELYAPDAREQLRRWDAGDAVWSIELGGLGPGYEQAIQMLAIELVRDHLDKPLPEKPGRDWGDETVTRLDATSGGFSGAQVGQARWLAWKWLTVGPARLCAMAKEQGKEDDLIQVSSFWPRAPGATP